MKISRKTLSLPAREGARVIASKLLRDADAAARRLSRRSTPKSLHDFRVALRRLRSWLKSFRPELGPALRRKEEDRLRAIARATSLGRDADVQLAWARETARRWKGKRRRAAARFARHLTAEKREADAGGDAEIPGWFREVSAELHDRLDVPRPSRAATASGKRTLAQAMAREVGTHLKDVTDALDEVRSVDDDKQAHRARIDAKHLRYLMEPAAPFVKRGGGVLRKIKTLQNDLGVLHDAHLISHAAERATSDDKLGRDVPRRAQTEMDAAFQRVKRRWLKRRPLGLDRDVKAFAKRLSAATGG
ncbi:MAG: CHAD domain-containing protein [Gemmatimonadaceae bacterium]